MSRPMWLVDPVPHEVERALCRLERTTDVCAMAVMPDVHLARDVCIGTVTATRSRLLPNAVGGDIGCGMSALSLGVEAARVSAPAAAASVLDALYQRVPIVRHRKRDAPALPAEVSDAPLSCSRLEKEKRRQAALQLGTVGRGNHFLELQSDDEGGLWAMVHSASYHVLGRGLPESLASSSHGAGRAMSRTQARQRVSRKRLLRDTVGVFYDHRLGDRLREEAPSAYKDIERVMRAQRDLVRVVRRLKPLLVFKGA